LKSSALYNLFAVIILCLRGVVLPGANAQDQYADVLLDSYYSGANPDFNDFYGTGPNDGCDEYLVDPEVCLGNEPMSVALPTGSYVVLGFSDNCIYDGPGDDIFIDEAGAGSEIANVFVSPDGINFVFLGTVDGGQVSAIDLADYGYTDVVTAIKIEGLDNGGCVPGFDLISVYGLPNSNNSSAPTILNYQICFGESVSVFNLSISSDTTITEVYMNAIGCDSTVEVTVSVLNPGINVTSTSPTCFGFEDGSIQLTGDNTLINQVSWSNFSNGTSLSNLGAGIYTYEALTAGSCALQGTIELTEPNAITAEIAVSNPDCFGSASVSVDNISGGNGGYQINYFGIDPNEITASDNYQLTITDDAGCNQTFDYEIIIPAEIVVDLPEEVLLCPGDSYLAVIPLQYENAIWSNGPVGSQLLTEEGVYAVSITEALCTQSFSIELNLVSQTPGFLGNDLDGCDEVLITSSLPGHWSDNIQSQSRMVTQTGEYVFVAGLPGCYYNDTLYVQVYYSPVITLTPDTFLCEGNSIVLVCNTIGVWSNGFNGSQIEVDTPGEYEIEVSNANCSTLGSVKVDQIFQPRVQLGPDTTGCVNEYVALSNQVITNANYEWSTNENTPYILVSRPGMYSVTVTNICDQVTDSIYVTFDDCEFSFYLPNAITCDNDGINDYFKGEGENITGMYILIFDRWGEVVFESNELDAVWTGSKGSTYAPNGTYPYLVEVRDRQEVWHTIKGFVTVIR
jgi:gliding motility-associated-like protein